MRNTMTRSLLVVGLSTLLLGCGAELDSRSASLQSCYDTGFGLKCVSTPDGLETLATDVDGDGSLDEFVCGDATSASDSDSTSADSDESSSAEDGIDESAEDGDADSESDSASNSESDEDCGESISDGTSASSSESDADGDGDGDGVSDEVDCDCVPM